jgi:hypothetical protein
MVCRSTRKVNQFNPSQRILWVLKFPGLTDKDGDPPRLFINPVV